MREFTETFTGLLGVVVAIVPQYIELFDASVKIAAGIGGLALIYYSIKLKRLQIKKEKGAKKHDEKDI